MRSAKSLKAKGRYLQNVVKDKIVELFPYLKKKDIRCARDSEPGSGKREPGCSVRKPGCGVREPNQAAPDQGSCCRGAGVATRDGEGAAR